MSRGRAQSNCPACDEKYGGWLCTAGDGCVIEEAFGPIGAGKHRVAFRFELAGERWNWPVEGDDSIRAFRELLHRAGIEFRVVKDPNSGVAA